MINESSIVLTAPSPARQMGVCFADTRDPFGAATSIPTTNPVNNLALLFRGLAPVLQRTISLFIGRLKNKASGADFRQIYP